MRERAIALRKQMAENGVDYATLANLYSDQQKANEVKDVLASKIKATNEYDVNELVALLNAHFTQGNKTEEKSAKKLTNEDSSANPASSSTAEEDAKNEVTKANWK